ncbi:MAG: hypothetical protein LC747_06685, partial [Acidobacteria bacterium]|nr:hypothetical protein [Acidobacteriota bacterium]
VLDSLSANATLLNHSGMTSCALPVSPYVSVNLNKSGVFRPREKVKIELQFNNPSAGSINYVIRVLAGANR